MTQQETRTDTATGDPSRYDVVGTQDKWRKVWDELNPFEAAEHGRRGSQERVGVRRPLHCEVVLPRLLHEFGAAVAALPAGVSLEPRRPMCEVPEREDAGWAAGTRELDALVADPHLTVDEDEVVPVVAQLGSRKEQAVEKQHGVRRCLLDRRVGR